MQFFLILHNIRSVQNVGALFRTADAIGVSKIVCSGYTPLPLDRFGRTRADLAKTALGAESSVPWEYVDSITEHIAKLKAEGFQIVALEQTPSAIDYKKYEPVFPVALIVGNETDGVSQELLKLADVAIEIPMRGKKESLNLAVATGIALYRIADR